MYVPLHTCAILVENTTDYSSIGAVIATESYQNVVESMK